MSNAITNGYTEFIEKQNITKKLTASQNNVLKDIDIKLVNPKLIEEKDCIDINRVDDFSGQRFLINYRERISNNFSWNFALKKKDCEDIKKKFIYYEIEI